MSTQETDHPQTVIPTDETVKTTEKVIPAGYEDELVKKELKDQGCSETEIIEIMEDLKISFEQEEEEELPGVCDNDFIKSN